MPEMSTVRGKILKHVDPLHVAIPEEFWDVGLEMFYYQK